MDVNLATFISLLILGTGIFTLLAGAAMLKFGTNKQQSAIILVVGLVAVVLWCLLDAGPLDNAEVMGGIVGFIGAIVGSVAALGLFIIAIMKS